MNTGKIFAFALAGLTAVSAAAVVMSFSYDNSQEIAEMQGKFEIYDRKKMYPEAEDCYKALVGYEPENYELLKGYIDYCKEHGLKKECASACNTAMKMQPLDIDNVKFMIDYMREKRDKGVYKFIHSKMSLFGKEEHPEEYAYLSETYDEIKGLLKSVSGRYEEATRWSGGYAIVKDTEGKYSVIGDDGSLEATSQNGEIFSFSPNEKLLAVEQDGQLVYTNYAGNRKLVPFDEKEMELVNYEYLGPFSGGMANIRISDGNWGYITFSGDKVNLAVSGYERCIPLYNRIGAVKQDGKWSFFCSGYGEKGGIHWLTESVYCDLYLDESGRGISGNVAYVKKSENDGWTAIRFDIPGDKKEYPVLTEISSETYTEVRPFAEYGSVKGSDGKWRLMDRDGNVALTTDFEEIGEASCGLFGFREGDEWGFADMTGKVIIEPQYEGVTSFNAKGTCFVKDSGKWRAFRLVEYVYMEG